MATPTMADFLVFAPALAANANASTYLDAAMRRHAAEEPYWSDVYAEAMVYYAAFQLLEDLANNNAAAAIIAGATVTPAGAVLSRTAGLMTETYGSPGGSSGSGGGQSADDAALDANGYGKAYKRLRNSRAFGGPFLAMP